METALLCPWESANFLFVSSNVPLLINYSHFIAIFSAVAVSLLVFTNNPRNTISRLFLFFATLFTVWALLDIALWATNDPSIVMFAWSMQVLIEPLTYAVAFYLFYIFLYQKPPSFYTNLFVVTILTPLVLLLPTTLNLEAIALSSCESIEGPLAKYYTYLLHITFVVLIVITAFKQLRKLETTQLRSAILLLIGVVTFLLSFTSGNIIGSFTDNWAISQYGLFGMPIFAFLIAYSIIQFRAFKIEMTGAQILVVVLWALVCSLLFVDSEIFTLIVVVTLIFTSVVGYLLIRGVKREFEQRLELEQLAKDLKRANKRLKVLDKMKSEFVSIASHQLRSPLTSIRGYTSMLLEGSYGAIPTRAQEALERISESSKYMVNSVEDYLNVSRIESGNMKYEMSDFNLKDTASTVVDELRQTAMQKGLLLTFRSDITSKGIVNADIGKTRQALHNLINNSLKYTERGSIVVSVGENKAAKKIFVTISDTGIGMSEDTLDSLFAKFSRAKDANKTNISGTGLGLYVAKKMIEEMGGTITAQSDGPGKGSAFILKLPLQQ